MADLRKCIGSAKFGIEAHEAPADEFPAQPSQKDGLGPDVQAPLEPVHERAAEGGPGPQGGGGSVRHRAGAGGSPLTVAEPEPVAEPVRKRDQARAQGTSRRRPARRATPDSATPATIIGPRAPARGLLAFGRVVGHGRAHRGTWANVGAHGRTWADPVPSEWAKAEYVNACAIARARQPAGDGGG